ncbi:hypothetical protein OC834_000414 [Tilletia horrida]|nr:hypothetical protein OC834_000414 [Tilletia horrida]
MPPKNTKAAASSSSRGKTKKRSAAELDEILAAEAVRRLGEADSEERDADGGAEEEVGVLAEARKPATLAIEATVLYATAKKTKTGPGPANKKSDPKAYIVSIEEKDTFFAFQQKVMGVVESIQKKFKVGKLQYDDLELEAKVPKASQLWKENALPINAGSFKDFKENIFKPGCYYAKSKITINEADDDDCSTDDACIDADDEDESDDFTSNSDTPKKGSKRKRSQSKGKAAIQKEKDKTLKKLQGRWQCRRKGCNTGGHCLEDEHGKHHSISHRGLTRYVEMIVVARTASIDVPPRVLFDAETPTRGRGGPRPSLGDTPSKGSSTIHQDISFTMIASPSPRRSEKGKGRRISPPATPAPTTKLKRSLDLPLPEGPPRQISHMAQQMELFAGTVDRLGKAGYTRVAQLARAYEHNYDAFAAEVKLTASMLCDIEDVLKEWAKIGNASFDPVGYDAAGYDAGAYDAVGYDAAEYGAGRYGASDYGPDAAAASTSSAALGSQARGSTSSSSALRPESSNTVRSTEKLLTAEFKVKAEAEELEDVRFPLWPENSVDNPICLSSSQ